MNKKVCICGNDEFEATQVCHVDVIVDSENFLVRNAKETLEQSCYSADKPSGDYTCTKCGAEYENFNQLPKTKYFEELLIDENTNHELQELLDVDSDYYEEYIKSKDIAEDSTIFLKTISFDNLFEAEIKVCTGQNNAYVDCILFDNDGTELDCCSSESLLGEVSFEYDESIFVIDIRLNE